MIINLSAASDDGLTLILLRVPVIELIKKCTQVSPQWNRILSEKFFWRKKMEQDGYKLEWPKLVDFSTKSFKWMALKHSFERNFIKDSWNLDKPSLALDPGWWASELWQAEGDHCGLARIEIPPKFLDGEPAIPQGYDKPILACIAIPFMGFYTKNIQIKLANEGLTDDIMDNFRPTIVVSELIGNRRDCPSKYTMRCYLDATNRLPMDPFDYYQPPPKDDQSVFLDEYRDENGHRVGATIELQFKQGQDEGWHKVEYAFKDYPAGMRYLTLECSGSGMGDNSNAIGGLKLADCSMKAMCEKNAPE